MRLTRPMLAPAALVAVLALTGCGADGDGGDGGAAVPETATGSLEHLAAEAKCTAPNMQTDADTIRQALCEKGDEKYVLATFSTDRGQREWINTAKDYGGYYLVGRKWVAVGHEDVVADLRGRLGGTLEQGVQHGGGGHSAGHGEHAGHSG